MSEDGAVPASGGRGAPDRRQPTARGHLPSPLTAAAMFQAALPDRGITSSRIKAVDQGPAMLVAGERIVLCCDGCLWWATGRFRDGRTVVAIHRPAGRGAARRAARRLAGLTRAHR
jgi:hypothetical protein